MKKTISLLLALALCLGLCACNATNTERTDSYEDVKRELIGTWKTTIKGGGDSGAFDPEIFSTSIVFRFKSNGSFTAHSRLIHKTVGTVDSKNFSGTYTIQDGAIALSSTDGDELHYTYQNGTLSVYTDEYTLSKSE